MEISTIVVLIIIVAAIFYVVSIYNNLVTFKNRYQNAFSQIEIQLKRRYDLIPNLLETAKAYMAHERETLEGVINARNQAVTGLQNASTDPSNSAAIQELAAAENHLQGALSKFSVVVEAYPELKANETMMQFSEELTSTENRVAFSRQAFNDAVTAYNTYRQTFPPVFFAARFGHPNDAALLEFDDSEAIQEAPKVSF